jgi:putative ABC transport system substrate-binding protein
MVVGALTTRREAIGQQPLIPTVGFLGDIHRAFHEGLEQIGYVEGKNVAIVYRQVTPGTDPLVLATELVRERVTVIAAAPAVAFALAAKAVTSTIPTVFHIGADPLKHGLVASMGRPGGNITGVTNLNAEVGPKRLELMLEIMPSLRSVAILVNPTNPAAEAVSQELREPARDRGVQLHVLHASREAEVNGVFASLGGLSVDGLIVAPDGFFARKNAAQLIALAAQYAVPTIYTFRNAAQEGGLMSYGGDTDDAYRLLGVYVGRILKGERAGDLPVHQSTKVQLVINLKTAKALGLTIPPALLARADEVIE